MDRVRNVLLLPMFVGFLVLPSFAQADCNGNGVADATDIAEGTSQDCNGNGVPDECDIASGSNLDLNGNGIPDECICLIADVDCSGAVGGGDIGEIHNTANYGFMCGTARNSRADVNQDGMINDLDIDEVTNPGVWGAGNGYDCECEVFECNVIVDCNGNSISDNWDIASGTSTDCNENGIPDECDITSGTSNDCDLNELPDECQWDCDGDGIPDICEILDNTESDCNDNLIPDYCDVNGDFTIKQWAITVLDFSSQLGMPENAGHAIQATGEPDILRRGFNILAWAPSTIDSGTEYITLGYDMPVYASGASILETFGDGFVTQVDVVDMNDQLHTVWSGTDTASCPSYWSVCSVHTLDVAWAQTNYLVKGLKVTIDTALYTGNFEQIDAIALYGIPATLPDCNGNNLPDECDISWGGSSTDANGNGIPDECLCRNEDVTCDGYVDAGDLVTIHAPSNKNHMCADAGNPRTDVNRDGMVNDFDYDACREPGVWFTGNGEACECEVPDCVVTPDCNSNGVPDSWDIDQGTSLDCNTNGIPDECDITYGTSTDCDTNGVPDDCQWDCDSDGVYDPCEIAMGMDTDCDNNGFPDSCDLEGGFAFIQWADSVAGYSSQYDDGSTDSCHATQALGKPGVQEHGDNELAWATLNADDGAEYITLSYKYPVWATGATVVESMAPGFVTQIDAVDLDDQLHTVWSGPDTVNCTLPLPQCEIGELVVNWTKTTYLVKGLKITIDTTHKTDIWEEIDAVALHGELPAQTDCNGNGVHDDCERDCNENGIPDECDIVAGTSVDTDSNGIPDECDAPDILSIKSMADHAGITNDLGIEISRNPGLPNIEPRLQQPDQLDYPYIRVEFGKAMSTSVNGTDVTPASGMGQVTATANLASGDSSVVLITFSGEIPNQNCVTFDLAGMQAVDGSAVGDSFEDTDFCICYLVGDVDGDGIVTSADEILVEAKKGLSVELDDNLRADLDRSGVIDNADESQANATSGLSTTDPCYDCNDNGIYDSEEIAAGSAPDCNYNGIPDECDLASGSSVDLNSNGIPDECPHVLFGMAIANGVAAPIRDDGGNLTDAHILQAHTGLTSTIVGRLRQDIEDYSCCLLCTADPIECDEICPPEYCLEYPDCSKRVCADSCKKSVSNGMGGCKCVPKTSTSCEEPPPPSPFIGPLYDLWEWNGCPPMPGLNAGENAHVTVHTGNIWTKVPLITTYVNGETELDFFLKYNSLKKTDRYPLGAGWMHPYETDVDFNVTKSVEYPFGVPTNEFDAQMTFTDRTGRRYEFSGRFSDGELVNTPAETGYDIEWHELITNGAGVLDYHFTIINEDGSTITVGLDRPTVWTDVSGQVTKVYPKNENDNVIIEGPSGRKITLHYNGGLIGQIIHPDSVELPNGNQSRTTVLLYEYSDSYYRLSDIVHRWVETVDEQLVEKSSRRQYVYDSARRMIKETLENGTQYTIDSTENTRTIFVYDEGTEQSETIVSVSCAEGFPGYNTGMTAGTVHLLDGEGKEWVYHRDSDGRITQVDDPLGNNEKWTYGSNLAFYQVVTYEDKLGRITNYGYTQANLTQVTQTVDSQPIVTTYVYEDERFPRYRTKIVFPDNREHRVIYNDRGDIVAKYDAIDESLEGPEAEDKYTAITHTYWPDTNIIQYRTVIDRIGDQTRFEYDSAGNLIEVIEGYGVLNIVREYQHDLLGRVTRETVHRGDRITITDFSYDYAGRLVSKVVDPVTNGLSLTTMLEYDAHGNLIKMTDPKSGVTDLNYDWRNRFYQMVVNLGAGEGTLTNTFTLDGNGNITNVADANGENTIITYDDAGRQIQIKDAEDYIAKFTPDAVGNVTKIERWALPNVTTGASMVADIVYDDLNRVATQKIAAGTVDEQIITVDYDVATGSTCNCSATPGSNRPHKIVDADGHTVYLIYDKMDRVTTVIRKVGDVNENPDGNDAVIEYTYDAEGHLLTITDPMDKMTGFTYDSVGRRDTITVIDTVAGNQVTDLDYDGAGNVTQMTMPDGNVIVYAYDGANRLVTASDNEGPIVTITYDANGNVTHRKDANNNIWEMRYDAANRAVKVFDPLKETADKYTQYVYEAARLSEVINANNVRTKYMYDGLNRVLATLEDYQGTDERTTTYGYNGLNQLLSMKDDDNNETTYTYDFAGRLKTAVYPDDNGNGSGTVTFAYDRIAGNQNRVIRTDQKGIVATTTYNELKQMISRVFVNSGTTVLSEQFTYDMSGNMLTADNGVVDITNVYDNLGRLDSTTQEYVADSQSFTTQFDYAILSAGSTRTLTYPGAGGRTVVETLDLRGRLANINGGTNIGATWTYDDANRRMGAALGNSVTSVFGYDVNDRLTGITHASGGNDLFKVEYGYDAVGNRLYTDNKIHLNRSQQYVYDNLNRLRSFKRGEFDTNTKTISNILSTPQMPGQSDWTLDSRGNWDQFLNTVNGTISTETRTANGVNEYLTINRGTPQLPTHDDNGNLTLDPLAPNAGAPRKPEKGGLHYGPMTHLCETFRRNLAGLVLPGKADRQPEASLALCWVTIMTKRRQRVHRPCDRASKEGYLWEPTSSASCTEGSIESP